MDLPHWICLFLWSVQFLFTFSAFCLRKQLLMTCPSCDSIGIRCPGINALSLTMTFFLIWNMVLDGHKQVVSSTSSLLTCGWTLYVQHSRCYAQVHLTRRIGISWFHQMGKLESLSFNLVSVSQKNHLWTTESAAPQTNRSIRFSFRINSPVSCAAVFV